MSVTATAAETLKVALDEANPNKLADALRKVALGTILAPLKRTFTGLTGASCDLTATDGVGETAGAANPNRLAALRINTLRVTGVTASTDIGSYVASDAAGTGVTANDSAVVGIATISDDGKTITFPNGDATDFVIEYIPRPAADMTAAFARN
jgi:hypothetical protein